MNNRDDMMLDYADMSTMAKRQPGWGSEFEFEVGGLDREVTRAPQNSGLGGTRIDGVTASCLAEFEVKRLHVDVGGHSWEEAEEMYEACTHIWGEEELHAKMWEHRATLSTREALWALLEGSSLLPDDQPVEEAQAAQETVHEAMKAVRTKLDKGDRDTGAVMAAVEEYGIVHGGYSVDVFLAGFDAGERCAQHAIDKAVEKEVAARLKTEEGMKQALKDQVNELTARLEAATPQAPVDTRFQSEPGTMAKEAQFHMECVGSVSGLVDSEHLFGLTLLARKSKTWRMDQERESTSYRAPTLFDGTGMLDVVRSWESIAVRHPDVINAPSPYFFFVPGSFGRQLFGANVKRSHQGYIIDGALLAYLKANAGTDWQNGHYVQRTYDGGWRLWRAVDPNHADLCYDPEMAHKSFHGQHSRWVQSFISVDYGDVPYPLLGVSRQLSRAIVGTYVGYGTYSTEARRTATHTADERFAERFIKQVEGTGEYHLTGEPLTRAQPFLFERLHNFFKPPGTRETFAQGKARWGSMLGGLYAASSPAMREEYAREGFRRLNDLAQRAFDEAYDNVAWTFVQGRTSLGKVKPPKGVAGGELPGYAQVSAFTAWDVAPEVDRIPDNMYRSRLNAQVL